MTMAFTAGCKPFWLGCESLGESYFELPTVKYSTASFSLLTPSIFLQLDV